MGRESFRDWFLEPIHARLDRLQVHLFQRLNYLEARTMTALTDLQAAVKAEDDVIQSAITLIQGFAAQLAAAGTDPVALAALQSDIKSHADALAAAVAANTPAAPVDPTTPVTP